MTGAVVFSSWLQVTSDRYLYLALHSQLHSPISDLPHRLLSSSLDMPERFGAALAPI